MADSKTIQMIFSAKNLASKPVAEISAGVDGLVKKIDSLVPASERGEGSISQLTRVADQLSKAGAGLAADQAVIDSYKLLSVQLEAAVQKFNQLKDKADSAKLALTKSATTENRKDSTSADRELAKQQNVLNKLNGQLETVSQKALRAGVDLRDVAKAEAEIATVVAKTEQAYVKVNRAIDSHEENVQRAATKARELAESEQRSAAIAAKAQEDANRRTREGMALLDRAVAAKREEEAQIARVAAARQKETDAFWAGVRAAEARRNALTATVVAENEAAAAEVRSAAAKQAAASAATRLAVQESIRQENLSRTNNLLGTFSASQAKATASTRVLGTEMSATAAAAQRLFSAIGLNATGERQSLSFFQRLRGQVLSLTASYVGLFGAINTVTGVLDVVQRKNTVENSFQVAFGDKAQSQMIFVEKLAEKLGFRMLDLAKDYGAFAIASTSAGTSLQDTQFIFESFTEVSRALHLSQERTGLVFLALQQIMSKGKVSLEELQRQLGENLPGVIGVFATALGKPQAELLKMITAGQLGSKTLVNLALAYKEKFADTIAASSNTPQAAIGRFQTALDNLKLTIANGGFIESFTALLQRLTTFFKSPDGEKFAKAVAAAFKLLADVLIIVVDNAKLIATTLAVTFAGKTLVGIVAMRTEIVLLSKALLTLSTGAIAGVVAGFTALQNTFRGLIVAASSFGSVAAGIGAALLAITAGFASLVGGFFVGKWLSDSFAGVRKFGIALVGGFMKIFDEIRIAWARVKFWGPDREAEIARIRAESVKTQQIFAEMFADADKPKATTSAAAGAADAGAAAAKKAEEAAALAAARARAAEIVAEVNAAKSKSEAVLNARQSLQARIDSLNAESLRKEATNADQYVAAVRLQFKDLYTDIEKFGKEFDRTSAARMKKQLDGVVRLREEQARTQFARDSVDTLSSNISGANSRREQEISAVKERGRAKLLTDESVNQEIQNIQEKYRPQLTAMIEDLLNQIARLPRKTQEELTALVLQMQNLRDIGLQEKPDATEFLRIKQQAETVQLADKAHNAALRLQKDLLKSHAITQREYNAEVDRLRAQYGFVLTDSTGLLDSIRQATTLTDAQRLALAPVIQMLQSISDKEAQINEKKARTLAIQTEVSRGIANALIPSDEMLSKIHNLGDAWIAARDSMRTFFADFLANKAKEILAEQTLAAIKAVSSTFVSMFHSGGVVGISGANRRAVDPSWFASAPRYHGGGVAGLMPNEVPAVLKKGEEVLTEGDPRHRMNGGNGQSGPQPMNVKIVNSIDSGSVMEQGAGTASGQRAILNVIRANASSIRQVLR